MKKNIHILWLCICFLPLHLLAQNNVDLGNLKGQITERLKAKPLEVNGGVQLSNVVNWSTQPNPQPFTYVLAGNLVFKIKGYDLPFAFNYSNRKFNQTNPSFKFNRTAFNPKYKNLQGHFGDISMTFSSHTMAGIQFTGAGMTYQPKQWQIQTFYGRFLKAVGEDTTKQVVPTFKRMGTGIKVQYMKDKIKYGANIFYAADVPNSIVLPNRNKQVRPMENVAFALNAGATVAKNISFEAEFSTSVLTRNRMKDNERDTSKNPLSVLLRGHNASTKVYHAVKSSLNYNISKNDIIGIGYERIDPDYHTLGGFFFTNDLENITINAQHKGKININLNTGIQRDDIANKKERSAGRMVVSSNMNFKVKEKTNVNLSYSNFQSFAFIRTGFERINQTTPFDNLDTLNYSQLSQNATGSISHNIRQDTLKVQAITVNGSYMVTDNLRGGGLPSAGGNQIMTTALNYNHTVVKKLLTIGVGINQMMRWQDTMPLGTTLGPSISVAKQLWDKKLGVNSALAYNYTNSPQVGSIITLNIGANTTLKKVHSLNLSTTYQYRNTPKNVQFTINCGYTYNFQKYEPPLKEWWKDVKDFFKKQPPKE